MAEPAEDKTEQWRVGNKCMAPFSGDGTFYRASVRSITRSQQGHRVASVRFSGFTEEEDEIVDVRHLKKRPARGRGDGAGTYTDSSTGNSASSACTATPDITSPLKYVREEDRLRAKYADLFDDSDIGGWTGIKANKTKDPSPSSVSSTSSSSKARFASRGTNKRKTPVAVGGEVKEMEEATQPKRSPASTVSHTPPRIPVRQPSEKDSFGFLDEGFSCEEMEKPFFPGVSTASAKVPLVLSKDGPDSVIQVPATINRYLRDYQREGVKFLYRHYRKGEGAILGDDMGLGKTIQILAFLCAVLRKTGTKEDCQRRLPEFLQKKMKTTHCQSSEVFLIICPNSVLYNWLDEFETWTYCTVGKYHGRERQETLWKALKGKLDAVITSYETYRIYMDSLLKVKWAGVIVDEVHKIKEPGSQITQALKEVNTMCRYGLSGTALQNKLSELWCVLDWANPDCLGSMAEFKTRYEDSISKGQKFHASKRELADSRKVLSAFAELRDQWMIRRTKALISHELPTKDEKVVFCKLSQLQLSIYKALLESDDMQLVLKQKETCDCGSHLMRMQCCYKYNSEGEKVKALTMTFMSLLIKVSNHIALLTPDVSMSDKQRKKAQRYCDIAFARHPQFVALSREARFCTLSDPSYCGKMQILEKLLGIFKQEGSKVLLFSYYTQLLNIFEMYLKTTDYVYRRLDGKTPAQDRQKYVHEFNTDPDIFLFLISTKAGGLGLNLTGANVVIIFDPNWNPTYDLQAQDRAYRIGQHRDVRVYRLISTGSIEENMYLRQVYKQQLASAAVTSENPMRYFTAVAGDKKQQGELFGLHNMFALRADTSCLTKDLIQRHVKTEEGITMAKYVSPPPSASDIDQSPREEPATDSDRDSDSSHGDRNRTTHDEDINVEDDHGAASQFLSNSDLSDKEDVSGDEKSTTNSPRTRTKMDAYRSSNTSGKTKAPPHHRRCTASKETHTRGNNREQFTSESSSDEDLTVDRRISRGKAILHRDGQIEHRAKGLALNQPSNGTIKRGDRGQTRQVKRSEVTTKQGHRSARDNRSIVKERNKKSSKAVDDVFKECGVAFIHSNMKIVGGSRVEDHVSNIAMRDVYDLGLNSQQPANFNVPTLQDSMSDGPSQDKNSSQTDDSLYASLLAQSQRASHRMQGTTVLFGQTPKGIKRRHFQDMAKTLKHPSISDFARHVLSLPQEQYSELLQGYYAKKHPQLDLEKLYQPPKPATEELLDEPNQGKPKRRTKAVDAKTSGRRHNSRARGKGGVSKGCQFESLSEDEEMLEVGREANKSEREGTRRSNGRSETVKDDALGSDAEDVSKKVSSSTGASQMSRSLPSKHGKQTRRNPVEKSAKKATPPAPSGSTKASLWKVSNLMNDSDEDWLGGDLNPTGKSDQMCRRCHQRTQAGSNCACDTNDRLSDGPAVSQESSSLSVLVHKEENLSFLDDIFLTEQSKKPPKPPPKKKSPRTQPKKTVCVVRGDFSDSDIEMEDLSDFKSAGGWSLKSESHHSIQEEGGTLWKRNSKFATRQSTLEQASLEAKLESRSVFEKYAESFVPNEHFTKRDLYKEHLINVEETNTIEDGSASSELQPTTSVVAETASF